MKPLLIAHLRKLGDVAVEKATPGTVRQQVLDGDRPAEDLIDLYLTILADELQVIMEQLADLFRAGDLLDQQHIGPERCDYLEGAVSLRRRHDPTLLPLARALAPGPRLHRMLLNGNEAQATLIFFRIE